jgi:hypothetical protein
MKLVIISTRPQPSGITYSNYSNALKENITKDKNEIVDSCLKGAKDKFMNEIKHEIQECIHKAASKICEAVAMMLFMENRTDQQQLHYNISVFHKLIQDHINVEIESNLVAAKIINESWKKDLVQNINNV